MHSARLHTLKAFCERLGLELADFDLLDRALTHASAVKEGTKQTDYESLEFVGDAVLGLSTAHYLFEHSPTDTPGSCSQMRARVVNKKALAKAARRLDLGPAISLGRSEEAAGGRSRESLLADIFESTVGAIYLDRGWETANEFVLDALRDELESVIEGGGMVWDARSKLQHVCQAQGWELPEYNVTKTEGPDHARTFTIEVKIKGEVLGSGVGRSKKDAEQEAAHAALHTEVVKEADKGEPAQ